MKRRVRARKLDLEDYAYEVRKNITVYVSANLIRVYGTKRIDKFLANKGLKLGIKFLVPLIWAHNFYLQLFKIKYIYLRKFPNSFSICPPILRADLQPEHSSYQRCNVSKSRLREKEIFIEK